MGNAIYHQGVKKIIQKYWLWLLVLGILFLGGWYRLRYLQAFPPARATYDEEAYLWVGKSLLRTGVPTSWSFVSGYGELEKQKPSIENRVIVGYSLTANGEQPKLANWKSFPKPLTKPQEVSVDGTATHFTIVQPFLDHPPLGGIIFALFDRNQELISGNTIYIRRVAITLALFGLMGVFFLTRELKGTRAGLLALALGALGAGYVISSRLALPENILAAIWPWYLWLATKHLKKPTVIARNLLFLAALLLPLVKVSGVIIPGSVAIYFFQNGKSKQAMALLGTTLLGVFIYLAYGYFYDPASLKAVLSLQGARHFYGPQTVLLKLLQPQVTAPILDGFIFFGWFSFAAALMAKAEKQIQPVLLGILAYLGFFLIFGGEPYPWYQFIVFPLLAICSGVIVDRFWQRPNAGFNLLWFVVVICPYLFYAFTLADWTDVLSQFRLLALIFLLPLMLPDKPWVRKLNRGLLLAALVGGLWLSVRVVNNAPYWWPL